jgi:hypothetical protein
MISSATNFEQAGIIAGAGDENPPDFGSIVADLRKQGFITSSE